MTLHVSLRLTEAEGWYGTKIGYEKSKKSKNTGVESRVNQRVDVIGKVL